MFDSVALIVSILYVLTAISLGMKGNWNLSMVYVGYAFSNVFLYLMSIK